MDDLITPTEQHDAAAPRNRRTAGGREAKRAARAARSGVSVPYITRKIPYYEVLDDEGLEIIERNADTILEEVGIDFRDDAEALDIWRKAGADVKGERVRMPRGMCRAIVQASAPREFTQHARNPANNVVIGGKNTVFAPAYGSPFVRDLDKGRRYATIEDFQNFVKLAYTAQSLHHSGGTICEPVDLPVNKRHFDMVYAHMKYSDKPCMGSVTHPDRPPSSRPSFWLVPCRPSPWRAPARKPWPRRWRAWLLCNWLTQARRWCWVVLPPACLCSRARPLLARRSPRWCCTPWRHWRVGWACRFAQAAPCAAPRLLMRKPHPNPPTP